MSLVPELLLVAGNLTNDATSKSVYYSILRGSPVVLIKTSPDVDGLCHIAYELAKRQLTIAEENDDGDTFRKKTLPLASFPDTDEDIAHFLEKLPSHLNPDTVVLFDVSLQTTTRQLFQKRLASPISTAFSIQTLSQEALANLPNLVMICWYKTSFPKRKRLKRCIDYNWYSLHWPQWLRRSYTPRSTMVHKHQVSKNPYSDLSFCQLFYFLLTWSY